MANMSAVIATLVPRMQNCLSARFKHTYSLICVRDFYYVLASEVPDARFQRERLQLRQPADKEDNGYPRFTRLQCLLYNFRPVGNPTLIIGLTICHEDA